MFARIVLLKSDAVSGFATHLLPPIPSQTLIVKDTEIPSPINVPAGCRFASRCPQAMDVCKTQARC